MRGNVGGRGDKHPIFDDHENFGIRYIMMFAATSVIDNHDVRRHKDVG